MQQWVNLYSGMTLIGHTIRVSPNENINSLKTFAFKTQTNRKSINNSKHKFLILI